VFATIEAIALKAAAISGSILAVPDACLVKKPGSGPSKRLKVTLSTRDQPFYRDPAMVLLDLLKEIYFDVELEPVETATYFPKI
jgi:hypothetical protein